MVSDSRMKTKVHSYWRGEDRGSGADETEVPFPASGVEAMVLFGSLEVTASSISSPSTLGVNISTSIGFLSPVATKKRTTVAEASLKSLFFR